MIGLFINGSSQTPLNINKNAKACQSKMSQGLYALKSPEPQVLKDPICGVCQGCAQADL